MSQRYRIVVGSRKHQRSVSGVDRTVSGIIFSKPVPCGGTETRFEPRRGGGGGGPAIRVWCGGFRALFSRSLGMSGGLGGGRMELSAGSDRSKTSQNICNIHATNTHLRILCGGRQVVGSGQFPTREVEDPGGTLFQTEVRPIPHQRTQGH